MWNFRPLNLIKKAVKSLMGNRQEVSDKKDFFPSIKGEVIKSTKSLYLSSHHLRNKTKYGRMRKHKRNIAYRSKLRNCYGLN